MFQCVSGLHNFNFPSFNDLVKKNGNSTKLSIPKDVPVSLFKLQCKTVSYQMKSSHF